ncbi:MAG: LptE family protein [Candidatus Omnitrophota bacterium]|jgi:outer membrane lipopolysaccharide assembly protein LptE/RlpB
MFKKSALAVLITCIFFLSGCGYTTHSMMAPELRSIFVDSFSNKINIADEQSDARMYKGYRAGMENEVTKAIIDRYLFDGNLKIGSKESASLILKGELVDFRKEPLRYDTNDNIEEYRLIITVNLQLHNAKTGSIMWKENYFSGEATYRTTGSLARGESSAMKEAVADLARRVVERTIEGW